MRTFFGIFLLVIGFLALVNGALVGLLMMVGGVIVLATGRSTAPEKDEVTRIPLPSERGGQSLVEERPRVAVLPPTRIENDTPDVAALRSAVETLAKRQNSLEQSRKLQKATARIRHLEGEVERLGRRLERLDPTSGAQADGSSSSSEVTAEPSHAAVDSLARFLDPS